MSEFYHEAKKDHRALIDVDGAACDVVNWAGDIYRNPQMAAALAPKAGLARLQLLGPPALAVSSNRL